MKKLVFSSIVIMFVTLGWGSISLGEQSPTLQGELHIVDDHPLNWAFIAFNVFDHLVWIDKNGNLAPQLATEWHWPNDRTLIMSLRQGVTFHNGEVFNAEIVKLNWEKYTQLNMPTLLGEIVNFEHGSRLEIIDLYTVRFVFPEPDGGALLKLAQIHIANRDFYRELGWGEKGW